MDNNQVNQRIELWRDPQTGVHLPFIDMRLVSGRLETADQVFTYLNGEMDGQPCLIQLAYWRWPEASPWVEQAQADLPPLPDDFDGELPDIELSPWLTDTTPYAPSPVFVSDGRSDLPRAVLTAVLSFLLAVSLCMWSSFLLLVWGLLSRGGGR